MTPRRRNVVFVSLVAAVAAGGFAFTYWVLTQQAQHYWRSSQMDRLFVGESPGTRQVDPLGGRREQLLRTTPDTLIVRRTYYPDCGDVVVESKRAGPALSGKTAEELVQDETQATIESFSPKEVEVLITAQGACPTHATQRYLGIVDGHVAVFQGLPSGRNARALEVFDLEAGALPEREVQDLRRGVPIRSDEELKRVLQSYLELVGY